MSRRVRATYVVQYNLSNMTNRLLPICSVADRLSFYGPLVGERCARGGDGWVLTCAALATRMASVHVRAYYISNIFPLSKSRVQCEHVNMRACAQFKEIRCKILTQFPAIVNWFGGLGAFGASFVFAGGMPLTVTANRTPIYHCSTRRAGCNHTMRCPF